MTRVKLVSDLHTEFYIKDHGKSVLKSIPNIAVDVLVVAGDLTTKYYEENLSLLCDRFDKVIYVAGNHDCLDKDTELLTKRGWIKYDQINKDDLVLSIDNNDKAVWSKINNILIKESEYIYKYSNSHVDMAVTENHRIAHYKRFSNTSNFSELQYTNVYGLKNRVSFPNAKENVNKDYEISDDEIKLLAWILTDGSVTEHSWTIWQSKLKGIEKIKTILNNLKYDYTLNFRNRQIKEICGKEIKTQLPQGRFSILSKSSSLIKKYIKPGKEINKELFENFSSKQMKLLVETMMDGDGSWRNSGTSGALDGTKAFLDWVQLLCVQCGIRSSISEYRTNTFRLNITMNKESTQVENVSFNKEKYNDVVWCLSVPHTNFAVRRNNKAFFTGNCWYRSFDEFHDMMSNIAAKLPNLHWLDNSSVEINGHKFLGTTLWFNRDAPLDAFWPDFLYIKDGVDQIFKEHDKAYRFLNDNVTEGSIVITHHLPSYECVHPRWQYSDTNVYFVSECDDIIYRKKPAYWLMGHTHDSRDLWVYGTKCVCNPQGYPREILGGQVGYNPNLIIEL